MKKAQVITTILIYDIEYLKYLHKSTIYIWTRA